MKEENEISINTGTVELMHSPCYLYSVRQAAKLCRQGHEDFIKEYLDAGFPVIKRKGQTFIRLDEIRKYQDKFLWVKAS